MSFTMDRDPVGQDGDPEMEVASSEDRDTSIELDLGALLSAGLPTRKKYKTFGVPKDAVIQSK